MPQPRSSGRTACKGGAGRTLISGFGSTSKLCDLRQLPASLSPFHNSKMGPAKLEAGGLCTPNLLLGPPARVSSSPRAQSFFSFWGPGCGCRHVKMRAPAVPASCPGSTAPQGSPTPPWLQPPSPTPFLQLIKERGAGERIGSLSWTVLEAMSTSPLRPQTRGWRHKGGNVLKVTQ